MLFVFLGMMRYVAMEASGLLIGIYDSEDWLLLGTYFLGPCTGHVTAHIIP